MTIVSARSRVNRPYNIGPLHIPSFGTGQADLNVVELGKFRQLASTKEFVQTDPVPTNTTPPAITGDPYVEGTLTVSNGVWQNASSYARKWQVSANGTSGWADIPGATATTYTLTNDELTKYIRVNVAATGPGGSDVQASNVVGPVTVEMGGT